MPESISFVRFKDPGRSNTQYSPLRRGEHLPGEEQKRFSPATLALF
jgi:hypothetical protein